MKFYETENKVICVIRYAGKNFRGVAKCSPSDTYNPIIGCELAHLRCEQKLALAKYKSALAKADEADLEVKKALEKQKNARSRAVYMEIELRRRRYDLDNFERTL